MTEPSGPPDFGPPDFQPAKYKPPRQTESPAAESPAFDPPDVTPPELDPPTIEFEPPTVEFDRPVLVQPPPPLPRRRSPALGIVLICLGVILAVLAVADRVTPRIVGDQLAGTLQSALGTQQRPEVRLHGFPFLTQLVTRHFRQITITARDVPVASTGGRLSIDRLDGTLTDVRPDPSYRTIEVGRFAGSATVSYAELSAYAGNQIRYDDSRGDGFVAMSLTNVITVTGMPALDPASAELYLDQPQFSVGGHELPGGVPDSLLGQLFRIPLPALVDGVEVRNVRAGPSGLVLTASGTNVTLRR